MRQSKKQKPFSNKMDRDNAYFERRQTSIWVIKKTRVNLESFS